MKLSIKRNLHHFKSVILNFVIAWHADEPMGAIGICRLINTTSSNCWDGTQNRTEDIEEFDGEDVLDQGKTKIHIYYGQVFPDLR